ncbi:class I SAM-dependent methyltransferase [Gilvimarinus sp. F26214L]|uniref:class I SAM-dependent methyltransferase n=1 Tax=Gilvimarinus sp. DZF01 TaxID=3461371 RepID=UPI0040457156
MNCTESNPLFAVLCRDQEMLPRAVQLAHDLGLPLLNDERRRLSDQCWFLQVSVQGLAMGQGGRGAAKPVTVDFVGGKLGYRRKHLEALPALVKAVGVRKGIQPKVWDLTAGLGQDAFILARYGCTVTMVERHPLVYLLLADGLERARATAGEDDALGEIINRLELVQGDSLEFLATAAAPVADVIYIDTMFPERSKSAKVKKGMQLFQHVVGEDDDADRLLSLALESAPKRVVVKRPRLAASLGAAQPALSFTGKSVRFDVYPLHKLE